MMPGAVIRPIVSADDAAMAAIIRMRTVYLHTSHHNLRSQAAIERLGAHRDGVIRQHKRHKDGALRDTVCYSILDTEWPAIRKRLEARLTL